VEVKIEKGGIYGKNAWIPDHVRDDILLAGVITNDSVHKGCTNGNFDC